MLYEGSSLACAVAKSAMEVLIEEKSPERSMELGEYFMNWLREIDSPHVKELRGKGLMIGVEIMAESGPARPFCECLMNGGLLAKETHHQVIRFARL